MNVDLGIWEKLTRVVGLLIVIAIILGVCVWYLPLIQQNERMRKEMVRLDAQVQKNEEALRELRTSLEALRSDPEAIARLARDKFGYAKPGETIIRFEETPTNSANFR